MRKEHPADVEMSLIAVIGDALAIFLGFLAATWVRFDSGWFAVPFGRPSDLYVAYGTGAAIATPLFLFVHRSLGLFVRPQLGTFADRMPRLIRATAVGILLSMVIAFIVKNRFPFSTGVLALSFFTTSVFVLVERLILFRVEIDLATRSPPASRILIVGTDAAASHLKRAIASEPRLRSEVVGFLHASGPEVDKDISPEWVKGGIEDLSGFVVAEGRVDQVILTDTKIGHDRILEIIMLCERNLVGFSLVPDLFRILTGRVDIRTIGDVQLLGIGRWPLDYFWNRAVKRMEDIAGATVGLILSSVLLGVAAVLVKRSSPGPVFFRQDRCGQNGRTFTLYKLRTMPVDAEAQSGPVWATKDDPRCTRIGAFLRRHNLDELPQLWNVLEGKMSLVGPRPERPYFVRQFKEDINQYMSRHVSKPGMTGWAQVNGFRGQTSMHERIKYDLYYLENWSLAFDFKILVKTLSASENAY